MKVGSLHTAPRVVERTIHSGKTALGYALDVIYLWADEAIKQRLISGSTASPWSTTVSSGY